MELWIDMMSPPSRLCKIFVQVNDLPVTMHLIKLGLREQRHPAYLALNPLGKVPFLKASSYDHNCSSPARDPRAPQNLLSPDNLTWPTHHASRASQC